LLSLLSCESPIDSNEKYQKPTWLEGKIFSVAQSVPEISQFTECVERVGLDEILDKSGLYTLMAPTNDAFAEYLEANNYSSIDDIDSLELEELVQIHILINPWSKDQMRELNSSGWIDTDDEDAYYTGYKRETFLQPDNKVYEVLESTGNQPTISSNGNSTRTVYSGTNKYASLFYSEYMGYRNVTSSDFEFYYDRSFESSEIYFAGALILSSGEDLDEDGIEDESYAAENGYVYLIDRVIEPIKNAEELLFNTEDGSPYYTSFGTLINEYALFEYNEDATLEQAGASDGLSVDNLYDINYSNLAFNIATELSSIYSHNSLFAPSNDAYSDFENNVLEGDGHYGGFKDIPNVIKTLIVDYHMVSYYPYYPSQAGSGGSIYNNADDKVDLSDVDILKTYYGSNSTFVGIDKVLMPAVLSSVAAPVILRPAYSSFFASIYSSGLFDVLGSSSTEYSLFAIPDEALENDSSLLVTYTDDFYDGFSISSYAYNREDFSMDRIDSKSSSGTSLRSLINGQIAIGVHQGICKKEFLQTLSGYYISFDRETGNVCGGEPSVYGYMGDSVMSIDYYTELSDDYGSSYGYSPSNGKTYSVNYWMQFPDELFKYSVLQNVDNQLFYQLIETAGLLNEKTGRLNFLTEGEALTIFVPTDEALTAIGAESLSTEDLQELIFAHFVTGTNMFTDNVLRSPSAETYFTVDNKLLTIGSSEADKIDIYDKNGDVSFQVEENDEQTNIMYLGWDNGDDTDGNSSDTKELVGVSVIVHFVDNVIQPDLVF
jgi:uncharacterized surface protein with fasciclin (FAS1) repeats